MLMSSFGPPKFQNGRLCSAGCVINKAFVETDRGVAFTYDSAVVTRRKVLLSQEFIDCEPHLATVVLRSMEMSKSQWRPLSSWQHFVGENDRLAGPHIAQHKQRRMEALAITAPEIAEGMDMPNVLDKAGLLELINKSAACGRRNACGT